MLGTVPLCEASGAEIAPWDDDAVLIADNQIGDRLFLLRRDPDGFLTDPRSLALPGATHVDDLEALAVVDGTVVAVGSHGRTSRCQRRQGKERVQRVRYDPTRGALTPQGLIDSTSVFHQIPTGIGACLEHLFVAPLPEHARALCAAIVAAEAAIDPEYCIPPLDIEGAAGVRGRLWLALRQPRVDGHAVLARVVAGLDELRLDGVVLVAVGDRGLRALTADDRFVWAIVGPGPPALAASSLFRLSLEALQAGAVVAGELVADGLPPASEGLVVHGDRALVLVDGDAAEEPGAPCRVPSLQLLLTLPR